MLTTRPELVGTYGMVASTHWLASSAGMAVLESGGNAFDAAVAAGLTLQVVEPHLNGPGGEVPILLHSAGGDRTLVVGGQGPAPAAANIAHFGRLGLDLVPGTGLLAACVPGAFDAWMLLLGEFGTLRLSEVMRYAIDYAGGGYPLVPQISKTIRGVEGLFRDEWTSSARVYLRGSGVPKPGPLFSNPDLAATYSRILEEAEARSSDRDGQIEAARDVFYRGFVAEAIERYVSSAEVMDTSGRCHADLLDGNDLAAYAADLEEPATLDYHGYTVCKTGPWGQGPVFLQQLALLAGFDLQAKGHNTVEYIHTVVECAKLAFADREAHYGDPQFVDARHGPLLHPSYADSRRELVGEDASYELRPGTVGGRAPRLPDLTDGAERDPAGAGEPTVPRDDQESGDTCHLDVVDRHGNMVSATPSGGWLQSSPVIPGLGFPLGTRAQMFWLTAGLPNSLEGGKRPRTTLTPSLALRDGEPHLAFGTPGGDQQDQWSLHFFLAHVHFCLNLQEAIDAPNFHTEHFPSSFYPRATAPGKIVPMLAKSWDISGDNKTYTFELQKGVKFHDGTLFDAEAVKYNLERYQKQNSVRSTEIEPVDSVEVVDDYTVRVELSEPYAPFLAVLTDRAGIMASPKAIKGSGGRIVKNPVGTGPFEFVERVRGDHITVKKNPDHWQEGLPKLDKIVYSGMDDENVQYQNLQSGELDLIDSIPFVSFTDLQKSGDFHVSLVDGLGYGGFYLNTREPPFDDKLLRQAVYRLVNRDAIVKAVLRNVGGTPANSPFSEQSFAYGKSDDYPERSVDEAKKLLEQAGKPDGFTFTYKTDPSPTSQQLGQVIKNNLKPAGINVKLEQEEFGTLLEDSSNGNFQALALGWSGRIDPDLNIYDFVTTDGDFNDSGYSNPEVDKLLGEARTTDDEAQRKKLYDKAMEILHEDVPYVYLYHSNTTTDFAMQKNVKGFTAYPDGILRLAEVSKQQEN